jgi:hypothetical protein
MARTKDTCGRFDDRERRCRVWRWLAIDLPIIGTLVGTLVGAGLAAFVVARSSNGASAGRTLLDRLRREQSELSPARLG